jgi:hypothetical protein
MKAAGLVTLCGAGALNGCSDNANSDTTSGGNNTGTSGSGAGLASGGSSLGGSPSGTAGSATAGSTTAGSSTAGNASGGVSGGGAGGATGGTAGASGGGAGGAAGAGGSAGAGGAGGAAPTIVYDFETDTQGWASSGEGVVVTTDAAQKVTGAKSLKVTVPALAADADLSVAVTKPLFWPGTVLTLHVYSPAGADGLWVQAFTQSNNWAVWDTAGNSAVGLVRGGWTTITYTVPQTFPGGLQSLGIQMGVAAGGVTFAGGDFYIDSVSASGGVESCTGTGEGSHDFETTDVSAWSVDGEPPPTDTALAHATDKPMAGTGSLKVSFTALPGGTVAAPTSRRIRVLKPVAYCTQEVTLNVWMPPGSEAIQFQGYSQYNNYDGWNAGAPPATITRDGWTEHQYTLPAVGAGGLQLLGIQINNTAEAPFTGDIYIDDVSW